jgi:hypothetical protein
VSELSSCKQRVFTVREASSADFSPALRAGKDAPSGCVSGLLWGKPAREWGTVILKNGVQRETRAERVRVSACSTAHFSTMQCERNHAPTHLSKRITLRTRTQQVRASKDAPAACRTRRAASQTCTKTWHLREAVCARPEARSPGRRDSALALLETRSRRRPGGGATRCLTPVWTSPPHYPRFPGLGEAVCPLSWKRKLCRKRFLKVTSMKSSLMSLPPASS